MAMSAKICTKAIPPCVPSRYGIYMHAVGADFYKLFADIDNNGMFTSPNPTIEEDILIRTVEYEDGIYLYKMEWDGCSPTGPTMGHLSFTPPDPITEIWIGVADNPAPHLPVKCSKIKLKLRIGTSGEIKSVIINQSGLVYVE